MFIKGCEKYSLSVRCHNTEGAGYIRYSINQAVMPQLRFCRELQAHILSELEVGAEAARLVAALLSQLCAVHNSLRAALPDFGVIMGLLRLPWESPWR